MLTFRILFFSILTIQFVWSHGTVHSRIVYLNNQIDKTPHNGALYIERGVLYLEKNHTKEAYKDFVLAQKDNKIQHIAHYYLAQVALKKKEYILAKEYTLSYIKHIANNNKLAVKGYKQLASIYVELNAYDDAIYAYNQNLLHTTHPEPKDFLLYADVYAKKGKAFYLQALNILEKGINTLGSLSVFENRAIELEIKMKQYDNALNRLNNMISKKKRLPYLYVQKAEILEEKGDLSSANTAYIRAIKEIEKLSKSHQNIHHVKNMKIQTLKKIRKIHN